MVLNGLKCNHLGSLGLRRINVIQCLIRCNNATLKHITVAVVVLS